MQLIFVPRSYQQLTPLPAGRAGADRPGSACFGSDGGIAAAPLDDPEGVVIVAATAGSAVGRDGEVIARIPPFLHCLLLRGLHTIIDWTHPRPFFGAKNKTESFRILQ